MKFLLVNHLLEVMCRLHYAERISFSGELTTDKVMLLMFFGVKRHAKWAGSSTGMKAMLGWLLLVELCTIIIQKNIMPYHITCEHHIMTCEYHIISRESGEYHIISYHVISYYIISYL